LGGSSRSSVEELDVHDRSFGLFVSTNPKAASCAFEDIL
jgi:hypothetical protein